MPADEPLRRFLLYVTIAIFAGSIVELLLLEHFEEAPQFIPFVLCTIGIVATVAALRKPGPSTARMLRNVMIVVALGAVAGVVLHVSNNIAFELEMRPNRTTGETLWKAIRGASPLLAPGVLLVAAALAIASTRRDTTSTSHDGQETRQVDHAETSHTDHDAGHTDHDAGHADHEADGR